jgi:hypothetical protein
MIWRFLHSFYLPSKHLLFSQCYASVSRQIVADSVILYYNLTSRLQVTPRIIHAFITLLLSTLSICLTTSLSATVSYIYAVTLILVTFVAPGVLVWAQKYKKYASSPI